MHRLHHLGARIGGRRLLALVLLLGLLVGYSAGAPPTGAPPRADDEAGRVDAELRARAARADDLRLLRAELGRIVWPDGAATRSGVVDEKHRLLATGDRVGAARMSGLLGAEAQIRAARVLAWWVGRLDPETGLLPKGLDADEHLWDYADAGADLYPHLLIAARFLSPGAVEPLTGVIPAEDALSGAGLPRNIDLDTNVADPRIRDRMYGAVEYAKDGLLPLTERLGAGPWFGRLEEIAQAVDDARDVQTRFGPIPSEEGEVNGQALQVLVRLYWATGDARYRVAAERIARAYLDLALPATDWVPTRSWDFERERTTTSTAQLRDHGNEVIAGLVEYHVIETALGLPAAGEHRIAVRRMLDRLLDVGRRPGGLWESAIDIKTGARLKDTLSDNWGYLYAAYLTQALIEERWSGGDARVAERYRAAAVEGLHAASALEFYPWQGDEQDGYADTIESALYLLNRLDVPVAARWVDRQAGTLFGAQDEHGTVEHGYLDGNFVRTSLLYAAWQSAGVRLDPWVPAMAVGAVRDGECATVVVSAGRAWQGRLVFDRPRHALHLHLPVNYPRLNEWPEWFTVDQGAHYRLVDGVTGEERLVEGAELGAGLPLTLAAGSERVLSVCPAGDQPSSP